jgi:hypothetical protein
MTAGSLARRIRKRPLAAVSILALLLAGLVIAGIYAYAGVYGLNSTLRRGGSIWVSVTADDPRLSASMRLALGERVPTADAGPFVWRRLDAGFEVAELPAVAGGSEVDRILLARIDPARFRFEVRNASSGSRELSDWMRELDAALVINGSYFSRYGAPDTPLVSNGILLGPRDYDAKHGAFVASPAFVGIRDLAKEDWHDALRGADNAMVSYPLLLAADGSSRAGADQRWLANRSFVGQDRSGRIVLGTTADAFFSLGRLAEFLRRAPLDLASALNLDGGPVACQGIALGDYRRDFCGDWEFAVRDHDLQLLQPILGTRRWGLPIVLAVHRK